MAEADNQQSNLSEEDLTKLCEPCSYRDVQKHAVTYCQVCTEYLCDTCEEIHRSMKLTRNHELKPLDESLQGLSIQQRQLMSTLMKCEIHHSETLTDYCIVHDTVICHLCKVMKHRKCDIQTVKERAKQTKGKVDFENVLKTTERLATKFKEIRECREVDKKKLLSSSKEIKQQIVDMKVGIVTWAEKMANDMLKQLSDKETKLISEIKKDIKTLDEIIKQLKYFTESADILGNDVPDVSLVLMKKGEACINDGEEIKDDILKEMKPVTFQFQQSDKLKKLIAEITSMGTLISDKTNLTGPLNNQGQEKVTFLEITSLTKMKDVDAGTSSVTGCTFLPGGELIICDNTNKAVKVFTPDLILKNQLQFRTYIWDVIAVSNNDVVVTVRDEKILQFLNVSTNINKGKTISVGMPCWGIDYNNDQLYVSCHHDDGKGGEIKVLTMDGTLMKTFNVNQGYPYYLSVNSSGDQIIVSTDRTDVICIDSKGQSKTLYSDSQLSYTRGLLLDSDGNIMVCGYLSHNIHVVYTNGTKHNILLKSGDGIMCPHCIAYRHSDKTLIVGRNFGRTDNSILAFTVRED